MTSQSHPTGPNEGPPSGRGRRLLRVLVAVTLALVAVGGYAFAHLGTFLAHEDPLTQADVIVVFAGTVAERPMEAADLYRSGYAPHILVTRAYTDRSIVRLKELGIEVATEFDLTREILLRLGIPDDALITPPDIHDNTAAEAQTVRRLAIKYGWRRIIVVTSKYHLRRAGLSVRRAVAGTAVQVIRRGSRYDESTPEEWWRRRRDIRWVASEVPKLMAYALGLGD